jgi:hypothetical protein
MPDIDDFHGSSDITKIATKAVMLAPSPRKDGQPMYLAGTFMSVEKDRMDGLKPYIATMCFDRRRNCYEGGAGSYQLCRLEKGEVKPLTFAEMPQWAVGSHRAALAPDDDGGRYGGDR